MLASLRRLVRRGLERTGLIGPYYRLLERRLAREGSDRVDDGRPMPPADLLVAVVGGAGQGWFSETGRADAERFLTLAEAAGLPKAGAIRVLDFGCGCGRIARWLAPDVLARGGGFSGCDLNPRLVAWCRANLAGAYFENGLQPPLALETGSIDFAYAHSVLTHLTEATAQAWLSELRRVLSPGGIAVVTFHDEEFAARWGPPEARAGLARQAYFVWNNALEGSNYMSAWTTRARFAELAAAAGLEVAALEPGGQARPDQAVAVLRAPA